MLKCAVCGKEIDVFEEGYFEEGGLIYCEKCYADKRWREVDEETKRKWRENIEAVWGSWMKQKGLTDEERAKRREYVKKFKVPKLLEKEVDEL